MAYTYEDFDKRARSEGLLAQFTAEELATAQKSPEYGLALLSVKKDLAGATTEEQKLLANEAANQLRQAYGVSTAAAPSSAGGFVYSREDDYKKLFDSLTNPDGFFYDHSQDPAFSAYKKAQLREADRSMKDTLAAVSGATGGVPSSYAVTAAQQARDYEASKIGDIIPELYEAAYGRQQDALGLLAEDRENEYAKYLRQQAALEAARQVQLAGVNQQITGTLDWASGIVGDTIQSVLKNPADPGRMGANAALGKLLDAGNPYNAAVGSKVGVNDRLDAIRPGSYAAGSVSENPSTDPGYEEIRSAAVEAVMAGSNLTQILGVLGDAVDSGELPYSQYVKLRAELENMMKG